MYGRVLPSEIRNESWHHTQEELQLEVSTSLTVSATLWASMEASEHKWSGWDQISSLAFFASVVRVDNIVVVDEHMVVDTELVIDQHSVRLVWHKVVIDKDQVPQQPLADKAPDMFYLFP